MKPAVKLYDIITDLLESTDRKHRSEYAIGEHEEYLVNAQKDLVWRQREDAAWDVLWELEMAREKGLTTH